MLEERMLEWVRTHGGLIAKASAKCGWLWRFQL
jgi:hypothetical protein